MGCGGGGIVGVGVGVCVCRMWGEMFIPALLH